MRSPSIRCRMPAAAVIAAAAILFACAADPEPEPAALEIAVSFDETASAEPLDGRVLVMLSTDDSEE